jgi:LacI family transcriptional regulator
MAKTGVAQGAKKAQTSKGNGRLTQKALAKALGLSPALVSLVLNNPDTPQASEATKQRILEMVKANPGTGTLARGSDTLLVINKPERNVFYYQTAMLNGVQSRAGESGLKLNIASPDQDLRPYLFGAPLRGLLLTAPEAATEQVRELAKSTRVVTLNPSEHGDFTGDAVFPDYFVGMRLAVSHLLACGHTRLGYIGPRSLQVQSRDRERTRDFRETCEVHAITLDEADVHLFAHSTQDTGDREAVDAILGQWKKQKRRPTAFVVYNDRLAVKIYQAARALGIRIPDELSLIGFDNETVCEHLQPMLTSVSPEFFDLGRMAVDLLIASPEECATLPGRKVICPVRLIERESVCRRTED